ncbi:GNAT family N-acetyltransferase [Propionivibrio sp.]|uniref:GNAT family N-acetyltransferase n=1 Tax=Propionivibrio sp. TaxID=2212460 RepID=UPI0039E5334F
MDIVVREFEEADREALGLLYVASRNATFTWNPSALHQTSDFDLHTKDEKVLVALSDQKILGFASIWAPDSFLHNLFVHPSAIRRGIGQALLNRCATYFTKDPRLKCLTANENAVQFYKSQGWKALHEDIGPEGPYILMAKVVEICPTKS